MDFIQKHFYKTQARSSKSSMAFRLACVAAAVVQCIAAPRPAEIVSRTAAAVSNFSRLSLGDRVCMYRLHFWFESARLAANDAPAPALLCLSAQLIFRGNVGSLTDRPGLRDLRRHADHRGDSPRSRVDPHAATHPVAALHRGARRAVGAEWAGSRNRGAFGVKLSAHLLPAGPLRSPATPPLPTNSVGLRATSVGVYATSCTVCMLFSNHGCVVPSPSSLPRHTHTHTHTHTYKPIILYYTVAGQVSGAGVVVKGESKPELIRLGYLVQHGTARDGANLL